MAKLKLKYDWRLIRGERYFELDRRFKTKHKAKQTAKKLRTAGRNARVIKVGGKWKVFTAKKE